MNRMPMVAAEQAIAHLDAETWQRANRRLVCKMMSEFSHELLFRPRPLSPQDGDGGRYEITGDDARVVYRFDARVLELEHWCVDADSIERWIDGEPQALDAAGFVLDMRAQLGIDDATLPLYLEEIASTLYATAYKIAAEGLPAAHFADADFQDIEAAMTEGHPAFVANSGRIGFDGVDYRAYTAEAAAPIRLLWVAAHKERATFTCSADRSDESHFAAELDADTRAAFARQLTERGLDPHDYHVMPVHPWQWDNAIVYAFAHEIANRRLVYLGFGPDAYQAQQSTRTLFNRDTPARCYVKMALSIRNMGFTRGLSPYYMRGTPQICDWIDALLRGDAYLASKGFTILREVAAIGYRHPHFEQAAPKTDGSNKMLAALWRESPLTQIDDGQRLMTMAALLHRDGADQPLLPALVAASGIGARAWIERYLAAYMTPLLHCFYAHDMVFMPHGENLILQLENHVPIGAILKDIGEETGIFDNGQSLPEAARRIAVEVPEALKILSILTDLFDCFFRFLAPILVEAGLLSEREFWERVAACIGDYQRRHPELADKFERFDLFAPTFQLSCLNRLQLRDNRQMIDLADPAKNLQFAGELTNPIAEFRTSVATSDTQEKRVSDAIG